MRDDAHASGDRRRQELLYDPNVPTPSHAEQARTLAARCGTATLCTLAIAQPPETPGASTSGFPYGSFVTFAMGGAHPIFLFSELAEHTHNLRADGRASLLIAELGEGDPLARARVTLLGTARPLDPSDPATAAAREAYLARHPNAAYYADFADFHFWQLTVESLRFIGGFGRMSWVTRAAWETALPDPLAPHAAAILDHMNRDHAEVMVEYCRVLTKAKDTTSATMTGVDRYGFELSAVTAAGPRPIRLAFSRPLTTPDEVRAELVALARRVRSH